jgi:hypothetical protein
VTDSTIEVYGFKIIPPEGFKPIDSTYGPGGPYEFADGARQVGFVGPDGAVTNVRIKPTGENEEGFPV